MVNGDYGRQTDPVERPKSLQKPKNDLQALTDAVLELTSEMRRNNALLERAVDSDEKMAALSASLFPTQPEASIDADRLEWVVQNGSIYIGFGDKQREATEDERRAVETRYPNALKGWRKR